MGFWWWIVVVDICLEILLLSLLSFPIFADEDDVKAETCDMFQLLTINKILVIMLNTSNAEIAKENTFLVLSFLDIIL